MNDSNVKSKANKILSDDHQSFDNFVREHTVAVVNKFFDSFKKSPRIMTNEAKKLLSSIANLSDGEILH